MFVFLLLYAFPNRFATLQTAAMKETKQSGLCAVLAACYTLWLCDCSSLEVDVFTTRTDCAKICRYIALQSHEMETLYIYFA